MAWPIRDQGWGAAATQGIDAYNANQGFNPNNPLGRSGGQQQGGGSMYGYGDGFGGMASALMGNQLGSYLDFGNQMQGAMGQMAGINLMNQRAQQNNNALNTQLGQTSMNSNALIQAALANAMGNIGAAGQNRQASMYNTDNAGVNLAGVQNEGAMARLGALPGILNSMSGLFGGGGGGGGLLGFQNSNGGQSAVLPGGQPSATQMAVQASQPLPQQAQQTATGNPALNPAIAQMAGGQRQAAPYQSGRDYLMQYLGRG